MNVSIITMTKTYNYGATMQAFALQTFLESLGHQCTLIDHMGFGGVHRTISLTDFSRSNLYKLPYKRKLEQGYRSFERFYDENMNMTDRYDSFESLCSNPPESDAFVTGSDQVWNPRDAKYRKFFLEFVPEGKQRVSYAASIGDAFIPEEKVEYYKTQLEKFDSISVRESQGKKLLEGLTQKEINVNCDPVFLLDVDKWRSLEKPITTIKKPYILCYMIYMPEWYNEWIKKIKRETGFEIICVGLDGFRRIFCDKYIRCAGPSELLWLIDNAEFVVSSSFHGNAFSVLYGKKLISLPDPKRPDRIHNLLSMFGLEECELYENNPKKEAYTIDYKSIEFVMKEQRSNAYKYLSSALKDMKL